MNPYSSDTFKIPLINGYCDNCKYCNKEFGEDKWECDKSYYAKCEQIIGCIFYSKKKEEE